jgi:acyl-coenzyme A thioesterase PaaI-like protein
VPAAVESLRTRLARWGFNFFPAYFGMGGHLEFIASDWREVRVAVPLTWRTRNYVGTIYGGSMYGAVDPIYMIMLIKVLGPRYVVWDKAAGIRFLKPGHGTLRAHFQLSEDETDEILTLLESARSVDRHYKVELVDAAGEVCAVIEKTLYIRRKDKG